MPGEVSCSSSGQKDPPRVVVLTCAFCGERYPAGTPATKHRRLTAHVKICKKHPMREVEAQLKAYEDIVATLDANRARLAQVVRLALPCLITYAEEELATEAEFALESYKWVSSALELHAGGKS